MGKTARTVLFGAVTILRLATPCMAEDLVLSVQIRDHAGFGPERLAVAQRSATGIFDRANIRVRWLTPTEPLPRDLIIVYVVPKPPEHARMSAGALGYVNVKDPGHFIYAIDSRIEEMRLVYGVEKSTLLGLTMAHEIAHLLTKAPHTADGIMHGMWTQKEMRLANQGLLVFSAREAEALRKAVAQRTLLR